MTSQYKKIKYLVTNPIVNAHASVAIDVNTKILDQIR